MRRFRWTRLTALFIAMTLLVAGCGGSSSSGSHSGGTGPAGESGETSSGGQQELRIGALFPFSGSLASLGLENFTGADIAREIANEQGWIPNTQITFVRADIPDTTAASNEANRLITQEGLKILMGSYSSGLAVVASQVAERNGVIHWEISGTAEEITGRGFKNVFRTNAPAGQLGQVAVDFAVEELADRLGIPASELKVALIHEDSNFGTAIGQAVVRRAEERGLNIVANESYSASSNDLSSLILTLKAAGPDVIIATSYLNDAMLFWKQARELDLNVKAIIGTSAGYSSVDFYKARGADAEGVFSSDPPSNVNPEGLSPEAAELLAEFTRRYQERTGSVPGPVATLGFTGAVVLFKHVLPNAASFEPEDVRAAALAVDVPEGGLPNGWGVKFAGPDEPNAGQNLRTFAGLNQWQNGELKLVYPGGLAVTEPIMVPLPEWGQR